MERLVLNDRVLVYDDITCFLVNLGSAIRLAESGHGLEYIKDAYKQLREFHKNAPTALEVVASYTEYLKALNNQNEK